ncbi:MAG: hypothetical protein WCD80_07615, partial [Desulfobaccales bacterium]
ISAANLPRSFTSNLKAILKIPFMVAPNGAKASSARFGYVISGVVGERLYPTFLKGVRGDF